MSSAARTAAAAPDLAHGHRPGRVENDLLHRMGPGPSPVFADSLFADDLLSSSVRSRTLVDLFLAAQGRGGAGEGGTVTIEAARRVLFDALKPTVIEADLTQHLLEGAGAGAGAGVGGGGGGRGSATELTCKAFTAGARRAMDAAIARLVAERQARSRACCGGIVCLHCTLRVCLRGINTTTTNDTT
jgi:hypothetical protein